MGMADSYRNLVRDAGAAAITHIGLVDETATELTGGSPAYARKAVTWDVATTGTMRPTADLTFDIPAGKTVAGWRGFTAATAGTNHGGEALTQEAYAAQGEYILKANLTAVHHTVS